MIWMDLEPFERQSHVFFQSRVKQRDLSCVYRSLKLLGVALSSSYLCFTVKRPCAEIWGLTKCQKISDTRHDMLPDCRCIQSILPTCWMLMYTSTFNERCVSCSWNATCFFTGSSNVLQRVRGQRHTEHTEPHWTILNHPEPSWNTYWYCERLWKIRIYLRIYHDLMMKSWLTQTFAQLGYAWLLCWPVPWKAVDTAQCEFKFEEPDFEGLTKFLVEDSQSDTCEILVRYFWNPVKSQVAVHFLTFRGAEMLVAFVSYFSIFFCFLDMKLHLTELVWRSAPSAKSVLIATLKGWKTLSSFGLNQLDFACFAPMLVECVSTYVSITG